MSEPQTYEGKPTAYLDQNILDIFVKNGIGEFGRKLAQDFQIVYSDETLKEIKRSVGYEKQFLDVLDRLNAWYLKVVLDKSFQPTGQATLSDYNVYHSYDTFLESDPVFDEIHSSMLQNSLKLFGGRVGTTFDDLKNEQFSAYEKLHDYMLENLEVLRGSYPDLANQLEQQINQMKLDMQSALEKSSRQLTEHVPDPKGWSGIKDYRASLDIGPKQLNNITPPNVLQQIWDICKTKAPYQELNWELEDFFGIKSNPIYPDMEYFDYQKVTSIYTHLNMLGYYPDSKPHKERRFVAANSDLTHASFGVFTDFLLSRDESFLKKTEAAYEYLGVNTQTLKIEVTHA